MARPRSFDARDQVPSVDSTDNIQFQEVIGQKADTAATAINNTNSAMRYLKGIFAAVGTASQIVWQQSEVGDLDEDGGRYSFDVGVTDKDNGAVTSANIDISAAVITLEKSTGGGAFSTAGITQPTVAKANGLVTISSDVVASEWQVGDHYKVTLTTISATNSVGNVEYMPAMVWVGLIVEDLDVKTTVDDIDTDLGEPNDSDTATVHGKLGTDTEMADNSFFDLIGGAEVVTPSVSGNRDGDIRDRIDAIANAIGVTDAASGTGFEENGTDSLKEQIFVSSTEEFKDFVVKTGGREIAATKSLVNAIGHDGTTNNEEGLSAILGADNNNNVFASTNVVSNEDGSILERLEQIQEVVNRGTGTSIAANKSLVDALGTDGSTVTDSAVSVLGAIGANNNNNAFDSSTVVANRDGSVLERSEHVMDMLTVPSADSTNNVDVADVVGNKTDASVGVASTTSSVIAYVKHMVDAIGTDNNNNAFDSSTVVANRDGSILERLEFVVAATDTSWKVQATTASSSSAVDDTPEVDMATLGTAGGTDHHRVEGAIANVSALGAQTSITFRVYTDINGSESSSPVDTYSVTATGLYNIGRLLGINGFASRRIRISVIGNVAGAAATVSWSIESSKATA